MKNLNFNTKEEAYKWLNRNNKIEPVKNILPAPIPNAFKDRYKNTWEREYASYLEQLKHLHQICWWAYEAWGFRLADDTFIYPDFAVCYPDHIEIHDTKGELKAQWWAKFKVLKELFPMFKYATVKKISGEWVVKYV